MRLLQVIQVSDDTKKAHMDAGNALKQVQTVSNTSKRFLEEAESLVDKINEFFNSTPATPEEIQTKASDVSSTFFFSLGFFRFHLFLHF